MIVPFSVAIFRSTPHIILLLLAVIAVSSACKQSAVFLCFSHTHNYLTKINSGNFAFNEEELNQLCRDVSTIEDCLMAHNCHPDDPLIKDFSDWIRFKSFSSFICNSEYLEHQPCFSENAVQQQLMNCTKLSDQQTFSQKDQCRGAKIMAECAALSVEKCGDKTINYIRKMIRSLTSECEHDLSLLESECYLNTLEFCFQSTQKFANLTPLHKQIHISNESNFEQICRSINFVKGCLKAYGCDSTDSLTFSSLVKFHRPLSFLCYSDSQDVKDVFYQDTCIPGCYNAGEVATYTTNCRRGFIIYLDQPKCSQPSASTVGPSHSKKFQPNRKQSNSEELLSSMLRNDPADPTETDSKSSKGKEVSSKVNAESYRGISEGNGTPNYINSGEKYTQKSDVIKGINLTSVPSSAVIKKSPDYNRSTELNIIQKAFATDHLLATFVGFGGGIFIGVLAAFAIIYLLVSCRRVKQYNRLGPFNNSNGKSIYKPTIAYVPNDGNGSKNSLIV